MLSRSWRGPSPLSAHDPRELGGYALDTVIVARAAGGNAKIFHGVAADGTEASVTLLLGEEWAERAPRLELARRADPPAAARIIDAQWEGAERYITREYLDGPDLRAHLADRGVLAGRDLYRLAVRLCSALHGLHRHGLHYGLLWPDDIIMTAQGPTLSGVGVPEPPLAVHAYSMRGMDKTLCHAPELLRGAFPSSKTDVYAWGYAVAFSARGGHPFGENAAMPVLLEVHLTEPGLAHVPPGLRRLVGAAMAKDPATRPIAGQLLDGLAALAEEDRGSLPPDLLF